MQLKQCLKYGVLEGLRYRANTISWFLADIALYFSVMMMYLLLFSAFEVGTYTKMELGLYSSTYFLINNLFAVFFAETVSQYGEAIIDGSFAYYQLSSVGTLKSLILLNFNFPASLSTPFLLGLNVYFISAFKPAAYMVVLYYMGLLFAVGILTALFLLINSLLLLGVRSGAISSAVTQICSIAEKPDTVFHPAIRKLFTFVIPAFMLSAVPSRLILGNWIWSETASLLFMPFLLYALYKAIEKNGEKRYKSSGF